MKHWYRFSPTLALLVLITGFHFSSTANAQFRDWNDRNGNWSDASKWNPNIVPGVTDIARIGILPQSNDADVLLDTNTIISGLQIFNGMRLHTDGHDMTTVFDTLITGVGSRSSSLRVENSSFSTRDLTNEARLRLSSGIVNISRLLSNGANSVLFGGGEVNLNRNGGVAFRNDGVIFTNGAPSLTFNQLGNGLIDLDGLTGDGRLNIRSSSNQVAVTFNGTELSDAFNGTLDLRSGNILDMNFSSGWTAASSSQINLVGNANVMAPSRLQGGNLTLLGNLDVQTDMLGAGSHQIEAATIIGNSANVEIESGNALAFAGPVTINGGTYVLEEDSELSFDSNTLINGGSFSTHSLLGSEGLVQFNGITAWQGNVAIDGNARQNGTALISGATNIEAGILDMDGLGNTHWNITDDLVVNTQGIDSTISNSFDGTMTIWNNISSKLTINLDQPDAHWTMAGEMNLVNPFNVGLTRLDGSQIRVTGNLNIDGSVGSSADLVFENPSVVSFADSHSILFATGTTVVKGNATFDGDGTLTNMTSGDLTLEDGVTLDNVRLENFGTLRVGETTGIVDIAAFENFEEGTVVIEISGYTLGDEYDFITIGQGQALLDGTLEVALLDVGLGMFQPEIGDEFTILTALNGVVGTFDNSPVSFANGQSYRWEIDYGSHDVTLRLNSIGIPEPGALFIGIGCLACRLFRRQRTS